MTDGQQATGSSSLYDVSTSLFFDSAAAKRSIGHLARAEDLVVFCGAGVSIDRTGMDWNAMAQRLLVDKCGWSVADAAALGATTEPVQLASIAVAELKQEMGLYKKEVLPVLENWLPLGLYPGQGKVAGGNSTRRLFELASVRSALGKKTTFVTTNYDISLEMEFKSMKKKLKNPPAPIEVPKVMVLNPCRGFAKVCKCGSIASKMAASDALVNIVYMHGRVPPSGRPRGKIVFSEYDYLHTRSCVETNLAAVFLNRNVLILGSSLRDAPLLQALMSTRDCTKTPAFKRFAIQPMAAHSSASSPLSVNQAAVIDRSLPARLKPYDTELLIPDFYAQVWQFVEEVRLSTKKPDMYSDPNETSPYWTRMTSWTTAWTTAKYDVEVEDSLAYYTEIVATTEKVEKLLADIKPRENSDEAFKLEVWCRSKDKDGSPGRSLQLWVSSSGVLAAKTNPRRARLSVASEYAAVRTYQFGRPTLVQTPDGVLDASGSRSPADPRWATFFSVPIDLFVDLAHAPVGVVTLASNVPGSRSKLVEMEKHLEIRKDVQKAMRDLGKSLLGLGAPATEEEEDSAGDDASEVSQNG